jgi:ATP-dependent RNA helicase SUPV3L1/SUV3
MRRRIVCHLGPTNSGKTYSALQALKAAESGVYCGPLRLLAWEVYDQLNVADVPCKLVTGQEVLPAFEKNQEVVEIDPISGTSALAYGEGDFDFGLDSVCSALHKSSTIEMTDTNTPVEVAVIDEIQLLADSQRGWAWTRALLGVPALEGVLHPHVLCFR